MVEINGVKVELGPYHRIKWVDEGGNKYWGNLWQYRFTPFGDLLIVYPYKSVVSHTITEEQVIDVDPLIKWQPPAFKFGDLEEEFYDG